MTESVQGPERLAAMLDELSRVPPYRTNQEKAEWLLAHGVLLPDSGDAPRLERCAACGVRHQGAPCAPLPGSIFAPDGLRARLERVADAALGFVIAESAVGESAPQYDALVKAVHLLGIARAALGSAPRGTGESSAKKEKK